MAQQLRTLAALPEGSGLILSTYMVSHKLTSVLGDIEPSPGLFSYQVHSMVHMAIKTRQLKFQFPTGSNGSCL